MYILHGYITTARLKTTDDKKNIKISHTIFNMNILLINPSKVFKTDKSIYKSLHNENPIHNGLLSIASYLIDGCHEVKYMDMSLEKNNLNIIKNFEGDIIALTSDTPNYSNVLKILQYAKNNTSAKTIIGGPHATFTDIETLSNEFIDFVIRGEGEQPLRDICDKKPLENVRGITYRDNGRIVQNPNSSFLDLNSIPVPAYNLIPKNFKSDTWNLIGSKGCPYSCYFCIESVFNGSKVRYKNIEKIIQEIKIIENFGAKKIIFNDDTFSLLENRVVELSKAMKNETNIEGWGCDTRVDKVSESLIKNMKNGNCGFIAFGIESGSNKILKTIKGGINKNRVKKSCKLVKEYDIGVLAYFMMGLPHENHTTAKETIDFAKFLKENSLIDKISASILVPYPGSDILKNPERYGIEILTKDWSRYNEHGFPVIKTKELSDEDIYNYWKELNEINDM